VERMIGLSHRRACDEIAFTGDVADIYFARQRRHRLSRVNEQGLRKERHASPHARRLPGFRLALGNPMLLEDLLVRHPKLRIFIAHGGEPWRRETIALMQMYQQVYMDAWGHVARGIIQQGRD